MATQPHSVEDFVPPLISSLVASAERLPELLELGTPEPVLAKNRRPILSNFVVLAVRFRVGIRTVAVFPLHREAIGDVWELERQINEWDYESLP